MNRFFKALLPAVMGWILCMVLSACENFLQGSDIQLQLENDIKYANAESYEIHVECGANEGQILTGTVLSKKVTDVFTVEFKASPVTCFLGWNAYEKKGNAYSPLSSDYVEFLEKETSSEGIHKTEVSLKKGLEGIYIKPLCYTVSPEPSQRSYANAPVILTFSEPVEEFENESNPFSYGQDNVQVLSGTNVLNAEDFFYKAEASLDRRSLMIQPKGKELKDFIDNQHLAFVTVSFSFGTEVCVSLNGKHFSLEGNSFSVKYIPSREEEPPLKYDLYALSEEIVFSADGTVVKKETGNQVQDENELFSFAEIGEFTDAEILRNRTAGTIYIYGKYHDADSGVKRISVAEQRVRNKNAGYVIAEKREVVYTLDNAGVQYFVKDGFTEFIVKHTLAEDSEDGAFAVNVKVQDACSNESEGAGFNAIKDTYLDLSNLIVQNYIDDLKKIYFTEEFTYTDQYYHDAQYV
ncbi:MAG: hypothetical protein J5780_04415, partial [Treponema sp.]|nr:hypothetical protein [Treponema sp.]